MSGLFLYALLLASTAFAQSSPFQDAFRAFVHIRKAEAEKRLLPEQNLDADVREKKEQELSAQITQARIDFYKITEDDSAALTPWQRQTLEQVAFDKKKKKPAPAELGDLEESFPEAKRMSALEWATLSEWFGSPLQQKFLRTSFEKNMNAQSLGQIPKVAKALWVGSPFPALHSAQELSSERAEKDALLASLRAAGFKTEESPQSAFIALEDQCEELKLALTAATAEAPVLLVSFGEGSALVQKTLDLHPVLLKHEGIAGWINLNGKLYGEPHNQPKRAPASLERANRQALESRQILLGLRAESFVRGVPFSAKFPIWNFVSASGEKDRNLRESILPEGQTYFLPASRPSELLQTALKR